MHLAVSAFEGAADQSSLADAFEACMRLLGQRHVDWRDRAHFFGLAATMMRGVLIDHARARNARKRARTDAAITVVTRHGADVEILDLDRALSRLQERYPRQARVVEMRYFADLEVEEIAICLDVSPATIKRDWQFARAWLTSELRPGSGPAHA